MNPWLLGVGAGWLGVWLGEHSDRWQSYRAARLMANVRGKLLLNVGCFRLQPAQVLRCPCGDVCLDVDPRVLSACASWPMVGDVRAIPYPDRAFGAVLCAHVLEHLPTVADAQKALSELHRVADAVYICSPSRLDWIAWTHPEHKLWVDQLPDGSIRFEQR